MWEALLWLYLINATLLIVHEIDSAYWKEWELMRLPGGAAGFMIIHVPLVFALLWGAVWTAREMHAGLTLSLVISSAGIFAFGIHTYFLATGRPEFRTPVSIGLLSCALAASLIQFSLVVSVLIGRPLL